MLANLRHLATTLNNCFIFWTKAGVGKDLASILGKVEQDLNKNGFDWGQVLYIHLYISDMNEFAAANEEYVKFITEKKCPMGVPSRSTIQLPLYRVGRGNAHVELLVSGNQRKNVLHVQSISCWAPCCIGPYSQATLDGQILYMAGQLGLDPPTMTLSPGGPCVEIIRAMENCEAVANCFKGSISSSILLVIYCSSRLSLQDRSEVQLKVEAFLRRGSFSSYPVFLYILAPDLPKRALVEVKPVLHIPKDSEAAEQVEEQDGGLFAIPESWDFNQKSFLYESCYQKWVIPGMICAATISISRNLILQLSSRLDEAPSNSHFSISGKHLEITSRFCFYLIIYILQENQLVWGDLTSLRFYFSTSLCTEAKDLELILSQSLSELTAQGSDKNSKLQDEKNFSVIPVLKSGRSASMDDLLTCELFASKI